MSATKGEQDSGAIAPRDLGMIFESGVDMRSKETWSWKSKVSRDSSGHDFEGMLFM